MIAELGRWWTTCWFPKASAANLAVARILIAGHALWMLASRDYAAMSDVPGVFWRPSLAAIRWRYLIVPGHGDVERLLQALAALALVGVLLGVAPRVCGFLAAVLLYHLAPLEAAIWTGAPVARGMTLAPTALLVLAASPSADALSIRPRPRATGVRRGSSRYGWALRLLQLLVCEIYFFSAIGKLERTGWAWGSPDRIRLWFYWFNQDAQSVVFGALGPWLAQYAWLCGVIGVATMVLEWTMPVALFWAPARIVLVPVALVFHVGVLLSMNIHVPEAWLILVLVDWPALAARLGVRPSGRAHA